MIFDIDEALGALLRRDVLDAAQVEVAMDAPSKDWAAKHSGPVVDVFLYDIREDTRRRQHGETSVRDGDGRITARRRPPRFFRLSYLVTAWTQRPQDEHRLLTAVLSCLLRYDAVPPDLLNGDLRALGLPVGLTVAVPPVEERSLADVWSALGGELRPSLDVVVSAPLVPGVPVAVAPLVQEPVKVSLRDRSM